MIDVTVSDVGPCKKQLAIRVPKEDIQAKLDESYDNLRHTASVDGFRRNHVPRRLLEKRFGEQVIEDVKQSLMAEASAKAVEDEDLKLLGEPSFESADFDPAEDFTFEVTVEIRPEFDIEGYVGLELARPPVEVTDEELETRIQAILRQQAEWNAVEDGKVQEDDRVVCDWQIRVDDEEAISQNGSEVPVLPDVFTTIGVENMAETLKDSVIGDTRTTDVHFPDDYPNEKYRDKNGVLSITIKEIRRASMPELTEELAKTLDFDSADELREEVRRQIQAGKQREADESLEEQACDRLLEKVDFEMPEGIVKRQAREYMRRQQMHLQMRGIPEEEIRKHLHKLRTSSEEAAVRNFRLHFILGQIADKEKIFVTENEVENMIASLANRYETTVAKMKQELEENDSLANLRMEMQRDKVIRFLLDKATTQDEGA